jgi:hypothetical protein
MHPATATFNEQQRAANWPTVWISLLILGVVSALSRAIQALEFQFQTVTMSFPGLTGPNGSPMVIPQNPLSNAFGGLIGAFIGFFSWMAILYVSAKIFGGQGTFLMQSYLASLALVPLGIIAAIAGIIPLLGGLIAFAAFVYGIVLTVFAVASAYRLTTGRAVGTVLLPVVVLAVLACVLAVAAAALIFTMLRGVGY